MDDERMKFTVGGNEFTLSRAEVETRLHGVEPEVIRELYVEVKESGRFRVFGGAVSGKDSISC